MITRTLLPLQSEKQPADVKAEAWQQALALAIRDIDVLLTQLNLTRDQLPPLADETVFPIRVPLSYVQRMSQGDPQDPLLRQVLPLAAESLSTPGYTADPVADQAAVAVPGLLHKYHGRVLLLATATCAIHCRYCFRQHFPYQDNRVLNRHEQAALDYIAADPTIHEVILSGGDPLLLTTARLQQLSLALSQIRHVRRLRIHSRLPVVLPERINAALLAWLADLPLASILVIHTNHPTEIDAQVRTALLSLRQAGVSLFNQAVLLKGVNDDVETLAELSERLFAAGVIPYYLHQLDKVQGAAHYEVSNQQAVALHQALRQRLPGYLLPELVWEQAGAASKIPLR